LDKLLNYSKCPSCFCLYSAACKLKLRQYDWALEDCIEALDMDPDCAKAHFRKGQALHGKADYEESLKALEAAIKLAPNDKSILSEIAAVKGEMRAYKTKECKAYSKFFS